MMSLVVFVGVEEGNASGESEKDRPNVMRGKRRSPLENFGRFDRVSIEGRA